MQKYSAEQENYIDFNCVKQETIQTKVEPYKISDIDVLMQEIEVLLTTNPYDVFNASKEFFDFKSLVFKTNISASTIQTKLQKLIQDTVYAPDNLTVNIEVGFIKGSVSDIGVIDVKVEKNTDYKSKPEYQRRVFTFA